MLELLRRAVKSWVAKALLALLVVSFAVWGIGDIARGLSTDVATVGDETVTAEAYARVLDRERIRFQLDPSQITSSGLDRYVLATLVREAAYDQKAAALGISAPDAAVARAVRADPTFQTAGAFDPERYRAAVTRAFGSVPAFEETVRRSIAANLLRRSAAAGSAPLGVAETIARRQAEERALDALALDAATHAPDPGEPDEAALEAYLSDNEALFRTEERRDATYLRISLDALSEKVEVAEDRIRALYDQRQALYAQPERRELRQIVYGDEAEAEAALARIETGDTVFDGLIVARGLSPEDADLGAVTRDDLDEARAEAVFGLDGPGVAGPVQLPTGWALLEVTGIEPGATTPYEDARADLRAELAADEARPEADRLAEEVADLRAAGATLEEVASELGLPLASVSGLTRKGLVADGGFAEGLPGSATFLEEAFAAAPDEERPLLDAPDGGYFALRVDAVSPSEVPPLADIRDRVAEAWKAAQRREALAGAAEAAAERVRNGETVAAVAEDLGASISTIGPLRRDDPDPRLTEAARETLFDGPEGTVAVSLRGDRATVAQVAAVETPASVEAQATALRTALAQSVGQDQVEYLGRALEAQAGVSVNYRTMDSVVSRFGG